MTAEHQDHIEEGPAVARDARDVAKAVADAATGNWVGAATGALKNRKIRRLILWGILGLVAVQFFGFLLLMMLLMGTAEMFRHPMMNFGSDQTIVERNARGQSTTIHFLALANAWEHSIRWGAHGEHVGLTSQEVQQVDQLQLNLSYGLLETFYEIGARSGVQSPLKSLQDVAKELQPSSIQFTPVILRKVRFVTVKDPHTGKSVKKRVVSTITERVLQNIKRYNGDWTVQWHVVTEPSGSQRVVWEGATLTHKDYAPLYHAEKTFNILHRIYDQQMLFGQAMVLDPNFYDPNALPMLQMLEGGSTGVPGQGVPMPKPQIIAILKQAIQMDGVPESWLTGLEIIVGHEDASGNPYAVDPIPVDGEHASGLMQMLPSTFWANHVPGYENIWNPLDNALSSLRYIQSAWGSPYQIPGVVSGYYKGY